MRVSPGDGRGCGQNGILCKITVMPDLLKKLTILADAAKYDASCASSAAPKRHSLDQLGIGSTTSMGICHSYAPDGRCISLLKILLSNWCQYDCLYCVNRVSSDVPRARFSVQEVVDLTLDFYRRNLIEGLFLSSGIFRSPDHTMEQLVEVARQLREVHHFRGYIHLKTIPDASEDLLARAGLHADRLSINIELPTAQALLQLAPEKTAAGIERSMARIKTRLDAQPPAHRGRSNKARSMVGAPAAVPKPPRFAPAGQSTQMVVGADTSDDRSILQTSVSLYRRHRLKRVYYSAFSPIPHASPRLPARAAPLMREHRLYQADWLMRFYGFDEQELVTPGGMLSLTMDPKLTWALAHPEAFPVDINRAARETLLRVPGLGSTSVQRLLAARRVRSLRRADVQRLGTEAARVLCFVCLPDHLPNPQALSAWLEKRFGNPDQAAHAAAGAAGSTTFGQGRPHGLRGNVAAPMSQPDLFSTEPA